MMEDVFSRLIFFVNNKAKSCSMDFGCITPLYGVILPTRAWRLHGKPITSASGNALYKHLLIPMRKVTIG